MKNKAIPFLLMITITFFIFHRFSSASLSVIGALSSYCVYPLLKIQQFIISPIQQWREHWIHSADLELQLRKMSYERDAFFAQLVELKANNKFFYDTQELVNFKKRFNNNGRIAHILARHLSDSEQFFLVDAGANQGISKDMIAVYSNCLVGKVVEVYPWYCKVCLITGDACKVASLCSTTGASGIHEGKNDAMHTSLKYVSHLQKVNEGDLILSSGEGLIFPQGFALGTIKHAHKSDLCYEINVEPVIDFKNLSYCLLLAKGDLSFVGDRN